MAKVGRLKSRKPNGLPSILRLGFGGGNINDLTQPLALDSASGYGAGRVSFLEPWKINIRSLSQKGENELPWPQELMSVRRIRLCVCLCVCVCVRSCKNLCSLNVRSDSSNLRAL